MYCPECGATIADTAKFCHHCGHRIATPAPESPAPPSATPSATISGGGTASGPRARGPDLLSPGEEFADRYGIESVLGRGGMGTVYLARDGWADRLVCLKVILPELTRDENLARRFLREGTQARDLRHRNIVAVYDVSRHSEVFFITMEYIEGRSMREWLRANLASRRMVDPETARRVLAQILDGLGEAHRRGVVHRDLKPENLMLTGDPEDDSLELKILDFGIARALDSDEQLTMPGATMGTPVYMAPEQETGAESAGPEADLYSAGVILYEILTGVPPRGRWRLPSEIRPDLPEALDRVVEKSLETHPVRRFATAAEFRTALHEVFEARSPPHAPEAAAIADDVTGEPTGPRLSLWTQGIAEDGTADGDFEARDHGLVNLDYALSVLAGLPPYPVGNEESEFCPPAMGFEHGVAINRVGPEEEDQYFFFPDETCGSFEDAEERIRKEYRASP